MRHNRSIDERIPCAKISEGEVMQGDCTGKVGSVNRRTLTELSSGVEDNSNEKPGFSEKPSKIRHVTGNRVSRETPPAGTPSR
jgi:hypothetical protein